MTKGAKNVFRTYKTAFLSSAAEKLYPESVLPQKKGELHCTSLTSYRDDLMT